MAKKDIETKTETTTSAGEKKTVKTTSAKKTAAKKTTAAKSAEDKQPAAKKTTTKKTTAKKAADTANTTIYVQFWGKEVLASEVENAIKKVWTDEMGNKAEDLKDLKIYIKPEDNGAHYVINEEITGFIGL
ncbi:MAG: hypothetical protein HUJ72_06315 [Blautia sp.]|nr:hypothetical protein [Blautia sp.]